MYQFDEDSEEDKKRKVTKATPARSEFVDDEAEVSDSSSDSSSSSSSDSSESEEEEAYGNFVEISLNFGRKSVQEEEEGNWPSTLMEEEDEQLQMLVSHPRNTHYIIFFFSTISPPKIPQLTPSRSITLSTENGAKLALTILSTKILKKKRTLLTSSKSPFSFFSSPQHSEKISASFLAFFSILIFFSERKFPIKKM
jgi:hypothetical protein